MGASTLVPSCAPLDSTLRLDYLLDRFSLTTFVSFLKAQVLGVGEVNGIGLTPAG